MEFDWDEGNRNKNLRYGVHDWEIEEAFADPRRLMTGAHRVRGESRKTLFGRSRTSGQYLRIVYTERVIAGQHWFRPISAMRMAPPERARYQQ